MKGAALVACAALVTVCLWAVSCAGMRSSAPAGQGTPGDAASVDVRATFPPGPQGALIAYGYDLLSDTPKYAGEYITAHMSCAACHPNGGRTPHQGSLIGTYAKFPQWNKRSGRFIALQDRIAECFIYSMNGRPPAYWSRQMVAITAYIAWLSRGAPVGKGFQGQEPLKLVAGPPNKANGARLFAARCISCHGVNGNPMGGDPPLWGPSSFNDKAGMSRMDRIAPFVRAAMPQDAPGTLTDQEAADVAAFILSHPRPHFDKNKPIAFPQQKASDF